MAKEHLEVSIKGYSNLSIVKNPNIPLTKDIHPDAKTTKSWDTSIL
jgi:hypothetical protein